MTQDQENAGGFFAAWRIRIAEAFRFAVEAIRGDHGVKTQALAVAAVAALATAFGFSHVSVLTAASWITIGCLLAGASRSRDGEKAVASPPAAPSSVAAPSR
jgi:hypothetical protein